MMYRARRVEIEASQVVLGGAEYFVADFGLGKPEAVAAEEFRRFFSAVPGTPAPKTSLTPPAAEESRPKKRAAVRRKPGGAGVAKAPRTGPGEIVQDSDRWRALKQTLEGGAYTQTETVHRMGLLLDINAKDKIEYDRLYTFLQFCHQKGWIVKFVETATNLTKLRLAKAGV